QIDQLAREGVVPSAAAVHGPSAIADVARAFHELVQKASLIRELESSSRRLAALSARVTQAQEEDRARIARELHDGLGQALTAVKMDLSAAGRQLGPEATATRRRVVDARKLIDESLEELRRLVFDLRPPALDTLGLAAALEAYGREWQERTGVTVTVEAERFEPRLPFEVETALYRICQEALANAAKHAQASRATIRVAREEDRVGVVVEDDGVGFDVAASTESENGPVGVGLLSMERRAADLGGVFHIESAPGRGTTVRVSVPLHREGQ
ncbi:MAG: sensor histidine kinase, partial [Armatimonadota bacterium]